MSSEESARNKSSWHVFAYRFKKFVRNLLIRPISIFFPKKLDGGRKGYDWNLTLVGITQFIYILSIVSSTLDDKRTYTKQRHSKCIISSTCTQSMFMDGQESNLAIICRFSMSRAQSTFYSSYQVRASSLLLSPKRLTSNSRPCLLCSEAPVQQQCDASKPLTSDCV